MTPSPVRAHLLVLTSMLESVELTARILKEHPGDHTGRLLNLSSEQAALRAAIRALEAYGAQ